MQAAPVSDIRPARHARRILIVAALGASIASAVAVPAPAAPADPPRAAVQLLAISVEAVVPPGSPHPWTRLVCLYHTSAPWVEGAVFQFQALAMANGRPRILTGVVRHANVCAGTHRALLYLSPAGTRRFGAPRAVRVDAFMDDEEVDGREWRAGADTPARWRELYDRRRGVLLASPQTPWFVADIDPGADTLSLPP